jgi:hypothetical protein
MNDKPKGTTFPKQKLHITHFDLDVPYSQGSKFLDRVQAINLSLPEDSPLAGKPLRMTIFNGDLKTYVRGKEDIAADVEERDRPDSEYGPDRTIVQVYDEKGEPVSRKKGGGGGYRGLSLEEQIALENVKRRSIEGQTSVAQVGQVLTCPTPIPGEDLGIDEEDWKRILGKYWKAVEKGLDNYLADPPQRPKQSSGTAPKAHEKAQDSKPGAEKADKVSKDQGTGQDPIKHVGDLLTRSTKLKPPVTREELCVAMSVNEPSEIQDLDGAWKKAQEISATKVQGKPKADETQEAKLL